MTSILKVDNIRDSSDNQAISISNGVVTFANDVIPTDNVSDLGTSSSRYKDLFLSGGAYIGGTGSANYLDDYEEGTWQPNFANMNASQTNGIYTKVGNLVTCNLILQANGSNTNAQITGVPFSMLVGSGENGGGLATYQNRNSTEVWSIIPISSSAISFYFGAASRIITGSETVIGTFSFFTNS